MGEAEVGDRGARSAPPRPVVRPLRWWDIEVLMEVERTVFGPTAWSPEAFWAELAQPATRYYLIAEDGSGQVLGYAGLTVVAGQADVQTLAVSPAAQGQGLGRGLLDLLLREAHRRSAGSLMLEVRADNDPAVALYRSFGFEQIALRRRYYQPGDVDALVMRLRPVRPVGEPVLRVSEADPARIHLAP